MTDCRLVVENCSSALLKKLEGSVNVSCWRLCRFENCCEIHSEDKGAGLVQRDIRRQRLG